MQQENAIRVRRISRLGKDEQAHPSKADTTYPLHRSFHRLVLAKRREFLHMHPRNCTETALGCHVSLTLINGCPLGVQNRKSSMRAYVFRFAPESGRRATWSACPFRERWGRSKGVSDSARAS